MWKILPFLIFALWFELAKNDVNNSDYKDRIKEYERQVEYNNYLKNKIIDSDINERWRHPEF